MCSLVSYWIQKSWENLTKRLIINNGLTKSFLSPMAYAFVQGFSMVSPIPADPLIVKYNDW